MLESPYIQAIELLNLERPRGRLVAIHGLVLEASGCDVRQSELVEIRQNKSGEKILAEVIGLHEGRILLMPFHDVNGLCLNSLVIPLNRMLKIPISDQLLGRVIDPMGEPLDDIDALDNLPMKACFSPPINPLHRMPINENLETGVRAIDAFVPIGLGQRMGIFAGSGVGKSSLLGMMTRYTVVDVIVIAFIGERGREVGEFIHDILGKEGLKRTVVVAASAEQTAVMRRQSAYTATTIAEYFRTQGKNVLLIMDSITRFAMAQREIGISTGESLGARGYPASTFSLLPPLIERAGKVKGQGSITSIYTVLVEGDDLNEPVTDHMRSLLDGHIVLNRELAEKAHFPAIDILQSVSRLDRKLYSKKQLTLVASLRIALSTYAAAQDFIELGAYESGKNQDLDQAISLKKSLDKFLQQDLMTSSSQSKTFKQLQEVAGTGY